MIFQPSSNLSYGHHRPSAGQRRVGLLLVLSLSSFVHADRNVTVDDHDSAIVYNPPEAWSKSADNPLNAGGSHMLTQNPNATASFNFTGIAIYFLSPLWPYKVNTAISLDSAPPFLVDLVDHSRPDAGQGPESVDSHVVWSATGLANTQHTLRISVGAGQPFGIMDGLIYSDTLSPSSPSSISPSTTGRVVASSTSNQSNTSESSSSKSVLPIALGTVFGLLGLLIILLGLWYFFKRRRRPVSEAWTVGGSAYDPRGSGGAGVAPNGHPYNPAYGAYGYGYTAQGYPMSQNSAGEWQNPVYAHVGAAPPHPQGPAPPPPSAFPGVPPNRAPNRYQPGYTLSTITEKSTPQMGSRTPLTANSPASHQSELGYYTASEAGQYSPQQSLQMQMHGHGQRQNGYGQHSPPQPQPQAQPQQVQKAPGTNSSSWK